MAKPRAKKPDPVKPPEIRVLPMELRVGDRLIGETAEWEVSGRPFTTAEKDSTRPSEEGGQTRRHGDPQLGRARARRGEATGRRTDDLMPPSRGPAREPTMRRN
jgi:hypothetical protein